MARLETITFRESSSVALAPTRSEAGLAKCQSHQPMRTRLVERNDHTDSKTAF